MITRADVEELVEADVEELVRADGEELVCAATEETRSREAQYEGRITKAFILSKTTEGTRRQRVPSCHKKSASCKPYYRVV